MTLEQKLLPDMIAENVGNRAAVSMGMQEDAVAPEAPSTDVTLHAAADQPARSEMQPDKADPTAANAALSSDMPEQATAQQVQAGEELAALCAEYAGLKEQLVQTKENEQFLREQIVSARGQRGDLVKIAEQMLGTLETMVVGGRLERPKGQGHSHEPQA